MTRGVVEKSVKENHRVESLGILPEGAKRKRIRWFESSARVSIYSFDKASESERSDQPSTRTYEE